MGREARPAGHWTVDRIRAAAQQCSGISEFQKRFPGAYKPAWKMGLLDALFRRRRPIRFSDEELIALAAPYETIADFLKAHRGAYQVAHNRGILDAVCGHMRKRGSKHLRCVYRIWNDDRREIYVGLTYDLALRHRDHIRRPARRVQALVCSAHHVEALTGYIDPQEAARLERAHIAKFQANGWTVLNSIRAGTLGGTDMKWSPETLADIARRCSTRAQMFRCYRGAYYAAVKRCLLDDIFASHENRGFSTSHSRAFAERRISRRPRGTWSRDRMREAALMCASREEFARRFPGAHDSALKDGAMDDLFSGHPNMGYALNRRRHGALALLSDDDLRAIAKQYESRTHFARSDPSAYKACHRRNLLDGTLPKKPTRAPPSAPTNGRPSHE